jgi:hypothetical protein
VTRRPARETQADSAPGDRPLTVAVGPRSAAAVAAAPDRGLAAARAFRARGLLVAAAIFLHGEVRLCGPFPAALPEKALA